MELPGHMVRPISVSKAILIGLVVVNGPVLLLLFGPLSVFVWLAATGTFSRSDNWMGVFVFVAGFVAAWLWWSVSVPRWRLWAFERVHDIPALKKRGHRSRPHMARRPSFRPHRIQVASSGTA